MKMLTLSLISTLIISISFAQTPCDPASAFANLDINNVGARVNNGGVQWHDDWSGGGAYFVPKSSSRNNIYGSGIWLTGLDSNNTLHASADEFWNDIWYPGPSIIGQATTVDTACAFYNQVWKINRWQVEQFKAWYDGTATLPSYAVPGVILSWPAKGNVPGGYADNLAPFHDNNSDGLYNVWDGDYPLFDLDGSLPCDGNKLYGDQCIYFIMNDHGVNQNYLLSLGVEMHVQAFAYLDGETMDNTTFYNYRLINRSDTNYHEVFFGHGMDPDVGCFQDDYIGSDVPRGLAIAYNADDYDTIGCFGMPGYNNIPPALGLDFVKTMEAPIGDGVDNDMDGIVDEAGETFQLSNLVSRNRLGGAYQGEPWDALSYNNYLSGRWVDSTNIYYGGTGHLFDPGATTFKSSHMFPGGSDQSTLYSTGGVDPGFAWSEVTEGNPLGDRRMIASIGPFDINSGDEKDITLSVLWAQDSSGNNLTAVDKLKLCSDTMQLFADNCFDKPCYKLHPIIEDMDKGMTHLFVHPQKASTYNWDFGDGMTSTDRFVEHTYAVAGTYNVCLSATNSCSSTSVCRIIDASPLTDLSETSILQIQVAPNPFDNESLVQLNNVNNEKHQILIFDLCGKLIVSELVNTSTYKVKGESLKSGTYLLKIVSSRTGQSGIRKIVKR